MKKYILKMNEKERDILISLLYKNAADDYGHFIHNFISANLSSSPIDKLAEIFRRNDLFLAEDYTLVAACYEYGYICVTEKAQKAGVKPIKITCEVLEAQNRRIDKHLHDLFVKEMQAKAEGGKLS